jgi:hypothetical protein
MALVIEDGTAKPDSNSYATLDELVAFAASRGVTLPASDPERETLLLNAIVYLEGQDYKGNRGSYEQALQWPRNYATIYGYAIASDEIPRNLKNAQLQLAIENVSTPLLPNSIAAAKGAVIEETVQGAVTMRYAEPAVAPGTLPVFTTVDNYLSPLLATSGWQAQVIRG